MRIEPENTHLRLIHITGIFRMHLWQTVVFLQRDRNFSISALMQSTAENADYCAECESAFSMLWEVSLFGLPPGFSQTSKSVENFNLRKSNT